MPLTFRYGEIRSVVGSYLAPGSGYTVTVLEPGGIASATSTGATITLHAGHGFAAGDKIIVGGDSSTFSGSQVVSSTTSTSITMDGGTYNVAAGDTILNLGADTGTSTPNWDAGRDIYSDPTGTTAITKSTGPVVNSEGEYQYYADQSAWEVIRSGSTVQDVVIAAVPQNYRSTTNPDATGYPLANVDDVALKLYRSGDSNPLLSFVALDPDDQYGILLRVGDRAQTSGDSRVLGYFSSTIAAPGATESQALYGINVYTGAGTGTQIGVHGIGQSLPGAATTQAAVSGVQGVASHLDTAGGTTTTLTGVNGTSQTGSGTSYTGVAQNMFGVRGNAQHRSTNITTNQMFGVYGLCSDVSASGVTLAAGARFDQPENATHNHCVVLYGTPLASLAFTDDLSNFRYIRWSTSNTRFEVSSNTRVSGTLSTTGAITSEATGQALTIGANTDTDVFVRFNTLTTEGNFKYKGASNNNFNFDRPVEFKTTAGITASTTQTQGQGALTSEINEVSTCANANDTVTLPSAVAGVRCVVINNGAQTLQIFPASGDNLGAGVNTATTLAAGSNVHYVAYDGTNWEAV